MINAEDGDRDARGGATGRRVAGGRRRLVHVFHDHPVVDDERRAAQVLVDASAALAPAHRFLPHRVVVVRVVVIRQTGNQSGARVPRRTPVVRRGRLAGRLGRHVVVLVVFRIVQVKRFQLG